MSTLNASVPVESIITVILLHPLLLLSSSIFQPSILLRFTYLIRPQVIAQSQANIGLLVEGETPFLIHLIILILIVVLGLRKSILHIHLVSSILMVARLHMLLIMLFFFCVFKIFKEGLLFSFGFMVLIMGSAAGPRSLW